MKSARVTATERRSYNNASANNSAMCFGLAVVRCSI